MAFVNTDARLKFTQFTGRYEELSATVNGGDALRVEVDRDLPFCTINAGAAVTRTRRSTPATTIHRTAMSVFFRRTGCPVQVMGKMTVKIQLRQTSLRVPVQITLDPLATAEIHLGQDFTPTTKVTWDMRNRKMVFYAPPCLVLFYRCTYLGCGCLQPQLVLPLGRPGPNTISYDNT